jgi:LacI family transcriptional regulator
MAASCDDETGEARVTDAMIDHSMDGVILIAPVSSRARLKRVGRTVPTVVIGRHGASSVYDAVTDDDFAGAGLVVSHLAGLGHRRIAHIEHLETDRARLIEMPNARRADGYRHAMSAHGLDDGIDIASTSYTREGGCLGARQLLGRRRRPTAIFAGADIVAMGVLDALTEAGLSVPADVSVAGYDNITFAAFTPVSLTTVDQAGRQIGATAARLLLDRIADRSRPTAQVSFSPSLVVRRTTAPPSG